MARASSRQELFLSVGGTVTPLQGALKAGKTALIEFSGDAEKAFEAVEQSMRDMVKDPGAAAKQLTQSYSNAFKEIRANAQQVLGADAGAGALNVLNANAAREAATAAETRAAAIRVVAQAAREEAIAQGGTNTQLTAYASAATVAEREAEQYAAALREQANTLSAVEGRMNAIVPVGKQVTQMSGQARAGMQQLSFQLGDVATQLAAGTPPTIVFAQQIGQVTQAIGLMAGEAKGFIGFIGGPWGMAISSALVLLTPLVAKMFEESDASKEATKAAQEHAQAVEALIQSLDRATTSTEQKLRQDYLQAESERLKAIRVRETNRALLEQAKANMEASKAAALNPSSGLTPEERAGALGAAAGYEGETSRLDALIAKNETMISRLEKASGQAASLYVKAIVEAGSTPEGKARRKYQRQEDAALAEANASKDFVKYARTLARINAEREKELKTLQDSNRKKPSATASSDGPKITPGEVGSLLKSAFGGTVTSTTGGKHQAGSLHYKGQAVDFVPKGGMASISKAQVRAALESQGVDVRKVLGPGDKDHDDHFHVSFNKTRKSREAIEKQQERVRQRELAEDISFVDEMRVARGRLLDAQGKIAVSDEARAQLMAEEADAEANARARKVALQLSAGKLDEAEAAQLLEINEQTRQARRAAIAKDGTAAAAEKQLASVRDEVQQSDELLRSQLQLATTREERARIERQLLANSYRVEKSQLAIEIAAAIAAKDWGRYAAAMVKAANLAERQSNDEKALSRQGQGDYQRYRNELGSIDSINDQIDNLKIDTIRRLGDELANAATKALGLKGALGDVVGQLIRIGLERQLLGPAADFLFGKEGAGGAGGLFGSIFKSLGFATGHVPGFADGIIRGPGTGTSDSIMAWMEGLGLIRVSNGESIMTAQATQDYGPVLQAMNSGTLPKFADGMVPNLPGSVARMPASDTLRLIGGNAGGEQLVRVAISLTEDLDARIDNRAAGVAVEVTRAAAGPIAQKAMNDTFAALGRPGL